jgi:hypothetical protein
VKSIHGTAKCCAVITAAFFLIALSECQDRKHNVIFENSSGPLEEQHIVIPATEITEKDVTDLSAILKKFDHKFYRIQPFENAKPLQPFGSLSELLIGKELVAEMDKNGQSKAFSRWTRVIGQGCFSRCTQFVHNVHHSAHDAKESADLVRSVTPILKKYSKQ